MRERVSALIGSSIVYLFPQTHPSPSYPICAQLEEGHSLFDYDVGLNDIIQLIIRPAPVHPSSPHSTHKNSTDASQDMDTVCATAVCCKPVYLTGSARFLCPHCGVWLLGVGIFRGIRTNVLPGHTAHGIPCQKFYSVIFYKAKFMTQSCIY